MYIGGYVKVSLSPRESTAAACAFSCPRAGLITGEAFVLFAAGFHWVSFDVVCKKVAQFAYWFSDFSLFTIYSSFVPTNKCNNDIIIWELPK